MTVWWCRGCGMEDTRAHDSCPTCGAALQTSHLDWLNEREQGSETVFELDTSPEERAAIVDALMTHEIRHRWEGVRDLVVADSDGDTVDVILDEVLGEDEDEDENGDDIDVDSVGKIDVSVAPPAVPFARADDIDNFLDGVNGLSDMGIYDEADINNNNVDDDDDYEEGAENGYEVLSRLFLSTGKLLRSRDDTDDLDDFADAAAEVLVTPTPFGIDDEMWADIQSAARNTAAALADDSMAPIDADLKALHNQLQLLV